jgi:signal transduction histidine kinase
MRIEVRDDGTGFDLATVRRGRGLDNMAARARAVGATIEFRPGQSGTSVILALPLRVSVQDVSTERPGVGGAGPVNDARREPV